MDKEHIYNKATDLLKRQGCISAARIQRGLGVGYCVAEKILEELIKKEHLVQGATKLTWVLKNNRARGMSPRFPLSLLNAAFDVVQYKLGDDLCKKLEGVVK